MANSVDPDQTAPKGVKPKSPKACIVCFVFFQFDITHFIRDR